MANPTEPYTDNEIYEAVRQARNLATDLTGTARTKAMEHWTPFLLEGFNRMEECVAIQREEIENLHGVEGRIRDIVPTSHPDVPLDQDVDEFVAALKDGSLWHRRYDDLFKKTRSLLRSWMQCATAKQVDIHRHTFEFIHPGEEFRGLGEEEG